MKDKGDRQKGRQIGGEIKVVTYNTVIRRPIYIYYKILILFQVGEDVAEYLPVLRVLSWPKGYGVGRNAKRYFVSCYVLWST